MVSLEERLMPFNSLDLLFPYGCWLNTPLPSRSAIAPTSAACVAELVRQTKPPFHTWINIQSWTSSIVVAPLSTPLVPVELIGGRAGASWAATLKQVFAAGVPIPAGVRPTVDSDSEICIVQPDWVFPPSQLPQPSWGDYRGRVYELFGAVPPDKSPTGNWQAEWGGRMVGTSFRMGGHAIDKKSGIANFSDPNNNDFACNGIGEDHNWLAQATSIPLSHTVIRKDALIRGKIRNPIGVATELAAQSDQGPHVWPAQRHDGGSRVNLPQGARFRLPASWEVSPDKPRLVRLIEEAMRDYGVVVTDTVSGNTGVTLRMEPGTEMFLEGMGNSQVVQALPWSQVQQIAVGSDQCPTLTA